MIVEWTGSGYLRDARHLPPKNLKNGANVGTLESPRLETVIVAVQSSMVLVEARAM